MIRINMFSQADSVKGQGVGSAYNELTALLRTRLVDKFYVTVNKYGKSDLTHYHTINPTFYANSFSPARGRKIGYVHFFYLKLWKAQLSYLVLLKRFFIVM